MGVWPEKLYLFVLQFTLLCFFFLDSFLFSMVAIYYINKIAASVHAPTTNPTPQVSVKTKKNR